MHFVGGQKNTSRNCRLIELVRASRSNHLPELHKRLGISSSLSSSRQSRMHRIFLLSPAHAAGQRARMIMSEKAEFELARRLRSQNPPTLGEVFGFLIGLYFRGKLAYASAFAQPARVLVITPNRGLAPAASPIGIDDLRDFGTVDIGEGNPRYREPLERDARKLAR